MRWRDHLPIHPAADFFPLMPEAELRELAEDIKANGLRNKVSLHNGMLLDGRNRLDALELLGWLEIDETGSLCVPRFGDGHDGIFDPYAFILSSNVHRRHLTADQRRELITKVLKAKPEASNRQIAKQVKADDKTVGKVRAQLEATAEIPQLKKTVGADGKSRGRPKGVRPKSPDVDDLVLFNVANSPESIARKIFDAVGAAKSEQIAKAIQEIVAPKIPDDLSIPPALRRGAS